MGFIVDAEEQGNLGKERRHQAALFYADNGMVASSDPHWLQGAFNTLVGLFDKVGLRTNFGKTFGMVFHPCQAAGKLLESAYGRRVTGESPTYRERLKVQVLCGACRELWAAGYLTSHLLTQHGRVEETRRQWSNPAAGDGPQTFRMTFLTRGVPRTCAVEGCLGQVATRTAMRVHFLHGHVLDNVVILEEGKQSHPRFTQ